MYRTNCKETTMVQSCHTGKDVLSLVKKHICSYYYYFLAYDFCRFCVVIRFFIPATTANDLRLRRISIQDLILLHYFLILILEKEPVFPFSMLSAKQENYHFYNVFGTTRSLTGDWSLDLQYSKPGLYH